MVEAVAGVVQPPGEVAADGEHERERGIAAKAAQLGVGTEQRTHAGGVEVVDVSLLAQLEVGLVLVGGCG